jgi:hypothetical protein
MQSGGVGSKAVILPEISFARLGVAPELSSAPVVAPQLCGCPHKTRIAVDLPSPWYPSRIRQVSTFSPGFMTRATAEISQRLPIAAE